MPGIPLDNDAREVDIDKGFVLSISHSLSKYSLLMFARVNKVPFTHTIDNYHMFLNGTF